MQLKKGNFHTRIRLLFLQSYYSKIKLPGSSSKTKGKTYTAHEVKNPDHVNNLVRHNEGFFVFRQLRNSPAYLETRKKDVFAMIRQLGLPTWFMSLSATHTRRTDLIRALGV